ncbi:MAG: PsiF family protein [Pseudomonadota bacterium]
MKKSIIAPLLLAAQFALAPLAVAEEARQPAPQQQRMRDCNRDAAGMQGQPRKDFMKQCLSGKQAENKAAREERREERQEARAERREENQEARAQKLDARKAQQERMKNCNAEAKTKALKGDARKAFMSQCLKAE